MIDYLTKNHLSIIIIGWLVISFSFGIGVGTDTVRIIEVDSRLGSINRDTTTITNPFTFQQGVTIDANADGSSNALTVSGTTTIARSFDGFMAGGGVAPSNVATGTEHTLYTHTGGPAICDTSTAAGYWDSTGTSPVLTYSVGTTTAGGAHSPNLIASTTLATTTDAWAATTDDYLYTMVAGEEITMLYFDGEGTDGNSEAVSTNFANWDAEFQVQCWLIGG